MPTLAGFITWVQTVMQIGTNYLPANSVFFTYAFNIAMTYVNQSIACVDPTLYELAVYNFAGDRLINFAQDQTVPISGIAWTGGTATATTSVAHGFSTGDLISISAVNPLAYTVNASTVPSSIAVTVGGPTTFSYPLADNPGAYVAGGVASETFFATMRKSLNIGGFVAGVITASNDETTGETLAVPDALKQLTLNDLQNLKTPWGRQYLAIAQDFGPLWGLS